MWASSSSGFGTVGFPGDVGDESSWVKNVPGFKRGGLLSLLSSIVDEAITDIRERVKRLDAAPCDKLVQSFCYFVVLSCSNRDSHTENSMALALVSDDTEHNGVSLQTISVLKIFFIDCLLSGVVLGYPSYELKLACPLHNQETSGNNSFNGICYWGSVSYYMRGNPNVTMYVSVLPFHTSHSTSPLIIRVMFIPLTVDIARFVMTLLLPFLRTVSSLCLAEHDSRFMDS